MPYQVGCFFKCFRNTAHIGQDRHEVGITHPAGNHMPMDMVGQSCPAGRSQIESNVEALGTHRSGKNRLAPGQQRHDLRTLLIAEEGQIPDMPVRRHQEMPRIIGKIIEQHKGRTASGDHVIGPIGIGIGESLVAKETGAALG